MFRLILLFVIILGVILRLVNISPFKFYPDSYQNLIVAENLAKYQSVVGYLGEDGMLFPQFVAWSRFGYPMLINLVNFFTIDRTLAAQIVAFLSSIFSIPLAYLFIKAVFKKKLLGLIAAFLLAISFNHVVWSGFIMTEAVSVFISLLFLWLLFLKIEQKSLLANKYDLATGAVLAFGFITRFEYLAWVLPMTFLIFKLNPTPLKKITNILVAFIFVLAIFLNLYFPLNSLFQTRILEQIQRNLIQLAVFMVATIVVIYFSSRARKYQKNIIFIRNLLTVVRRINWMGVLGGVFTLILLLGWPINLAGMRSFFANDFLLGLAAFWGITLMLQDKKLSTLWIFTIFSFVIFSIIYFQINPLMQRYITHLIPILLIPASFGLGIFLSNLSSSTKSNIQFWIPSFKGMTKNVIIISLSSLIFFQVFTSFHGMKQWSGGTWFRPNYEEKVSEQILKKNPNKENILLVSFPESYYYHTHLTTHSLTDYPPYIYLDESLSNRSLLIVQDMGMRDIFPNFSDLLDKKLTQYKTDQFFVNEVYHYQDRIEQEVKPVVLYSLTIKDLRDKITP